MGDVTRGMGGCACVYPCHLSLLSRSNPCVKGSIHLLTELQESCEAGNNHFWRDSRDSGGDKKKKEKVRKFSTSLACYDPARVIVASQFPE